MCSTRAGGQWVRRARGSTQPSRRSAPCYVLCCRAARIRSLATSREAVGKLLVPATQHGAGCGVQVCEGVGSRMVEQHCGRRLRCSRISVGNVWWWGVAMGMGSAPDRRRVGTPPPRPAPRARRPPPRRRAAGPAHRRAAPSGRRAHNSHHRLGIHLPRAAFQGPRSHHRLGRLILNGVRNVV